jgi:hypothetical protein
VLIAVKHPRSEGVSVFASDTDFSEEEEIVEDKFIEGLRCPLALSPTILEVCILAACSPTVASYCNIFSARRPAMKDFCEDDDNTEVILILFFIIWRSIWISRSCAARELNL